MIRLAGQYGMVVFLDPIETGSWLSVAAGERAGEGLRLRPVPREALREVPEHRLDERQRLPGLEEPVVGRARAGGREGHQERRPPSPSHGRAQLHGEQLLGRREVATADRARRRVHLQRHLRRGAQGVQPEAASFPSSWSRPATSSSRTARRSRPASRNTLRRQEYWTHAQRRYRASSTATTTPGSSCRTGRATSTRPAAQQIGYLVKLFAGRAVVSPRPRPEAHAAHLRLRNLHERTGNVDSPATTRPRLARRTASWRSRTCRRSAR